MRSVGLSFPVCLALAVLCSGCGGGGNTGLASAPGPVSAPSSTPSPLPAPGSSPAGLVSDRPFATTYVIGRQAADGGAVQVDHSNPDQPLQFRYDGASGKYLMTLPGRPEGQLSVTFASGIDTDNQVVTATGPLPDTSVRLINPTFAVQALPLTYTTYGTWSAITAGTTTNGQAIREFGTFAYGIPTASSDVPRTGSASYRAVIEGGSAFTSPEGAGGQAIVGQARLEFDFAQGGLNGYMEPFLSNNGFQPYEGTLGRFVFAQTVHSVGSTNFAGSFLPPGMEGPAGEFAGSFNGPRAAELMAWFSSPFQADMKLLYDGADRIDRLVGTLSGIWIGRKD